MYRKKIISFLLICNLALILVAMIAKIDMVWKITNVVFSIVIIPSIFAIFLFYILKPMNNLFIKKKMKRGKAATLTILIFLFIAAGLSKYFADYLIREFFILKDLIFRVAEEKQIISRIKEQLDTNLINYDYYNLFVSQLQGRIGSFISNTTGLFGKSIQIFANLILVLLVLFYLLRDGHKINSSILKMVPYKYKKEVDNTLDEGDTILSLYIIGQARVAVSLAIMIYIGYKIIGMTSALFLATTTFVLAFIPFIGFFISMIIPFIIAMTMGLAMVIKLIVLFIVAQTLKGRIVVPLIMGSTMHIHPVTDIFLVVGAAILFGPIGAFVIVPLYSLIKVILKNFRTHIKRFGIKINED